MAKCDICGREHPIDVKVYPSTTGATSFNYCNQCLKAGREPYHALVGIGMNFEDFNKTYQKKVVIPTLAYYGKSIEQFNKDVDNMWKEYEKHLKETKREEVSNGEANFEC